MSSQSNKSWYWLLPVLLVTVAVIFYYVLSGPAMQKSQPNVLFITMDSLRHDHLGCTGYQNAHTPNIDALAADGVVFREALAQGTFTRISLPSIVTGKYPFFTGVRSVAHGELDSTHITIAETLADDGYTTLCSNRMWSKSYYQGFQEAGPSSETTPQRTDRTIQALEQYGDGKFFVWLYYWDPHAPYDPPLESMRLYEPDYTKSTGRTGPADSRDDTGHYSGSIGTLMKLNNKRIRLTSLDKKHLLNLYDAEIAYVDQEIGRLMADLKKRGLYDNTLIILNADHGEGFGEHERYYHGSTVFDEEARVPLLIKPPYAKNQKKIVWGQVRNIDILPTILDYCGLEPPDDCNGESLRPFIEGDETPGLPSTTETFGPKRMQLMTYRHDGYKLTYDLGSGIVWLYDLHQDPGEKKSLLPEGADIVPPAGEVGDPARQREQRMRRELLDLLGLDEMGDLIVAGKDIKEIDDETMERLKALGYVE